VDTLYDEPAYYRRLFAERTADLPFYVAVTEGRDPVLELGVGTGRVARALVAAGRTVVGLDRAGAMIGSLDGQVGLTVVEADARTFDLDARFGAVLFPFNGLAHLHDEADLAAVFDRVRAHLAPDGRFAFDVLAPGTPTAEPERSYVPRFVHPRTGVVCSVEEEVRWGPGRLRTITTTLTPRDGSGPAQRLRLVLRSFATGELTAALDAAGFEVLEERSAFGDSVAYVSRAR
jgi:SAM-dependent methyltransferase